MTFWQFLEILVKSFLMLPPIKFGNEHQIAKFALEILKIRCAKSCRMFVKTLPRSSLEFAIVTFEHVNLINLLEMTFFEVILPCRFLLEFASAKLAVVDFADDNTHLKLKIN